MKGISFGKLWINAIYRISTHLHTRFERPRPGDVGAAEDIHAMTISEQKDAILRNREGVLRTLAEAHACLSILQGIQDAARRGLSHMHIRCANEIYRAAFSALVTAVGKILDQDDDVHSLPRLCCRLRALWAKDVELLAIVDRVGVFLERDLNLKMLTAWRNKVVAHRTPKATDLRFCIDNKVTIDQIETNLGDFLDCLNELSINFDNEVYYDPGNAAPCLSGDVSRLFLVRT